MEEYDSAVKAPLTKSITDALATLRQTYAKNRETELFADEDPAMSSPLLGSPNATPTIVISDLTKENQPRLNALQRDNSTSLFNIDTLLV